MVMVSDWETVFVGLLASVTVTVTVDEPAAVGVPATVQPDRVKPAGREPELIEHVYGVVPPAASIGAEYTTPTVPFGRVFVSVRAAGLITIVSGPEVVCCGEPESSTFTVTVELPAVVGVPLTVHPLSVKPAGSVPAVMVQLYGEVPPAAPMVAL
jgi:hypothetical protein